MLKVVFVLAFIAGGDNGDGAVKFDKIYMTEKGCANGAQTAIDKGAKEAWCVKNEVSFDKPAN